MRIRVGGEMLRAFDRLRGNECSTRNHKRVRVRYSRALFGGRAAREAGVARTEAIATWTEMLRDTIGAAHGLEAAISCSTNRERLIQRAPASRSVRSLDRVADETSRRGQAAKQNREHLPRDVRRPLRSPLIATQHRA